MNAKNDDEVRALLATHVRLRTRLAETDVCLTAAWRMLDSSRIAVAQCRRAIELRKTLR